MKKILVVALFSLLGLITVGVYYYNRWKTLWSMEEPKPIYSVSHPKDDTLRIVMIGDSWVHMRSESLNKLFQKRLSTISEKPVILKTKGKGGEKARGIYHLMFLDDEYGTKTLFSSGVDYCVIIVGINDAAANLGVKQYIYYMKLLLDFMLGNNIRPVLIEIPDVNIWNVYCSKPLKDLIIDYMRSLMTFSGMYHYSEYREALKLMLKDSSYSDSVIYVTMKGWNGIGNGVEKSLFLNDQIHLNQQGYIKLDSCIVDAIGRDLYHI